MVKERDTYESEVQLRNEENIDHEIIPSFFTFACRRTDRTERQHHFHICGEIIELSASYNNHFFDQYVLPKHDVREKSSKIASLRKFGNVVL